MAADERSMGAIGARSSSFHSAKSWRAGAVPNSLGSVCARSFCHKGGAIVIRVEDVRGAIVAARGLNVLLDSDLARLYDVQTSALVRAMKRKQDRFPDDFAFQLTREEWVDLLCQSGISSSYGGRRTLPFVFTEQGVAMLSGVLRSERAVAVNVAIM